MKKLGIGFQKELFFCIIYPKTNTLPGSRWCHSSTAQRRRGRGLKWLNIQPLIRPLTPARSFCICAGTDHTWSRESYDQIKSVFAHLWLLVSIPVPITSPPTVKSSNSGTMGIVQPSLREKIYFWWLWLSENLSRVSVSCPMVTRGSQRTVRRSGSIFKMSTRLIWGQGKVGVFPKVCKKLTLATTYIDWEHLLLVLHVLGWDGLKEENNSSVFHPDG